MLADRDRIDHLRLVRTEGVGPVTYRRLLERYTTPPPRSMPCRAWPERADGRNRPVVPTQAAVEAEFDRTAQAWRTDDLPR